MAGSNPIVPAFDDNRGSKGGGGKASSMYNSGKSSPSNDRNKPRKNLV